jgi:hypothetical protein
MRHDFAKPNLLDFAWQLIPCGKRHFNSFLSRKNDRVISGSKPAYY